MSPDDFSTRITAPFGAWHNDIDYIDPLRGRRLSASEHAIVHATEHDQLVVKSFYSLTGADVTPKAIREMHMLLVAGVYVFVTLKGRLIRGGTIEGFVMPYERPLEAEFASASTGTEMQRIEQLQALVRRMHAKGILHGDIKPDNVLARKSDWQLFLCDWAAAQMQKRGDSTARGDDCVPEPVEESEYRTPALHAGRSVCARHFYLADLAGQDAVGTGEAPR